MAPALLDLPHEVLHSIFAHVDAPDIASLSCCQTLHHFLKTDTLLYKDLYLNYLDDPREGDESPADIDWEWRLHEIVRIGKILASEEELQLTAGTVLSWAQMLDIESFVEYLLKTASKERATRDDQACSASRNLAWLAQHFNTESQKRRLLSASSLYEWAASHAWWQGSRQCESSRCGMPATDQISSQEVDGTYDQPVQLDGGLSRSYRQQASAKLHCLYGIPIQDLHRGNPSSSTSSTSRYKLRSDSMPIHAYARSRVYDLRQHTSHTLWGPFTDLIDREDESRRKVDWEKIEAIMLVTDYNVRHFSSSHELSSKTDIVPNWTIPFKGAAPYSFVSRPPPGMLMEPALPLEAQDPYNVTGTWQRIVCFLDYTELFDFNFGGSALPSHMPRPPLDTEEAIRFITMKIYVTKVEPPGENDGQSLPAVWFKGMSSSVRPSWDPNANSKIRGRVCLTPSNEVHWTSWSIFHGEERWRSEGIQVGGLQSGRGVLGYWFDKDFDEHGPAGPTAFWKVWDGREKKDGFEEGRREEEGLDLHALHMPMY